MKAPDRDFGGYVNAMVALNTLEAALKEEAGLLRERADGLVAVELASADLAGLRDTFVGLLRESAAAIERYGRRASGVAWLISLPYRPQDDPDSPEYVPGVPAPQKQAAA